MNSQTTEATFIVEWVYQRTTKTVRISDPTVADSFFEEKKAQGKKPKMYVEERIVRIRQLA